jgi:carboxypeptidase T
MNKITVQFTLLLFASFFILSTSEKAISQNDSYYWMKISAHDKFDRSVLANEGIAIEIVQDDYVIAYGSEIDLQNIKNRGLLLASSNLTIENTFRKKLISTQDFPSQDSTYHNYEELTASLKELAQNNTDLIKISSIAKTTENRDLWAIEISNDLLNADQKPAAIFMGGHHAREHLSVEVPLMWAQFLVREFRNGNPRVVKLLNSRVVHIIPAVNPDGMEYDIASANYQMWRKNRSRNSDGTYGVDLNRNYGYQWGTGGSSSKPNNETYMGPKPFSEIESTAIKNYVEAHTNITVLLSYHSFSKLILFPWGHKYDKIEITNDYAVHKTMADKMATWNGYDPQQSSELYIASGDTTDWSYGEHKIISFTFELDPSSSGFGGAGFYPGSSQIQPSFDKNLEPMMYLTEYADNPYRVLNIGIGPISP